MIRALLLAVPLALLPAVVLAQGNSPYNTSGSQAGGPLGGGERAAGAPGGTPDTFPGQPDSSTGQYRDQGTKAADERRRSNARE